MGEARQRRGHDEQRAHLETSAGGVVHRRIAGSSHVLLIRDRNKHWGFPKGHLEAGETAEQAALREVHEETGLDSLSVERRLRTIDWYFRFRGRVIHKFCHFFLLHSASGEPTPRREEGITACEWLPVDRALSRVSYENARGVLREAAAALGDGKAPDAPE